MGAKRETYGPSLVRIAGAIFHSPQQYFLKDRSCGTTDLVRDFLPVGPEGADKHSDLNHGQRYRSHIPSRWFTFAMAEKFNPAPKDKHAEDPKQAQKSD